MTMSPFERWSVWLTTLGTLVTGVAYWWMKELLPPVDPWAVINHPLQPVMLKAHILIAPLQIFAVGLITSRHIWRHYRLGVGKGRRTGITTALAFLALVMSGYLLQVFTAETLVRALGWLHLGLGIVYSLGVALHWPATRNGAPAGTADASDWRVRRPGARPTDPPSRARPGRDRGGPGSRAGREAVG